jgi:mono/diheme cytochrome c family protein
MKAAAAKTTDDETRDDERPGRRAARTWIAPYAPVRDAGAAAEAMLLPRGRAHRTMKRPAAKGKPMRSLYAACAAALALIAALLWWDAAQRGNGHPGVTIPDMNDASRIAAGRRIYDAHCASCHGANLEGQPDWRTRRADGRLPAPPHDDSGHTWHHPLDVLFAITKHGLVPPYAPQGYASDMPAFGERLSDEEIWNVLAFIRSRWSDKVRSTHDELQLQVRAQRGR